MGRLIQKIDIPTTLFDQAGQILHLPPQLVAKWVDLLNTHSLLERAKLVPPEGAYGGIGKEETDDHLAWRFTGSSARVMLAVLDPKEELLEVADAFAQIFSGNRVFLVDIPSGSGAVTVAILTIFAELRKQGRVPRIPLEVVVIGGEISPYGRSYFTEILNSLKDELSSQAIQITFEAIDWNVCDKFSNTELIKRLTLQSQNCTSRLLVLANFSAFLQKEGKWRDAEPQLEEIFRHSRDSQSIAIWIEPQTNEVKGSGGFIIRLVQWFGKNFGKLFPLSDSQKKQAFSMALTQHPLRKEKFRTHLVVMRFDLPLTRHT